METQESQVIYSELNEAIMGVLSNIIFKHKLKKKLIEHIKNLSLFDKIDIENIGDIRTSKRYQRAHVRVNDFDFDAFIEVEGNEIVNVRLNTLKKEK